MWRAILGALISMLERGGTYCKGESREDRHNEQDYGEKERVEEVKASKMIRVTESS